MDETLRERFVIGPPRPRDQTGKGGVNSLLSE
jgi:hypothetical protein